MWPEGRYTITYHPTHDSIRVLKGRASLEEMGPLNSALQNASVDAWPREFTLALDNIFTVNYLRWDETSAHRVIVTSSPMRYYQGTGQEYLLPSDFRAVGSAIDNLWGYLFAKSQQ